MKHITIRRTVLHKGIIQAWRVGACAAALGLAVSTTAWAQAAAPIPFDIPAQPLASALHAFAGQAGMQLLYRADAVSHLTAPPVQGTMDKRQALQRLLQGTDLEVVYSADDIATIRPKAPAPAPTGDTPKKPSQADASASPGAVDASETGQPASAASGPSNATTLNTVTVTGTRIRGGTTASPTITIDAQQFKQEGFTDLGAVVRSLPQNYGGGQNPGVGAGASAGDQTNHNLTGGSTLNLRGLGPGATLTLLNGQRLSYDGPYQAVDISAIPIEAVDRIEIVPDGASAIYGSDAVGGVANVILKRDFNGVTVGSLYGNSADGGGMEHQYTATAGTTWQSGGFIATFMKSDQDPIYADQRSYAQALQDPTTLYPGSRLRSGLLSLHQALGENVEFRLDALHTVRTTTSDTGYSGYSYFGGQNTTVTEIAPSLQVALPGDWMLTTGLSRGLDKSYGKVSFLQGGSSSLQSWNCYCNKNKAWDLGAEGPLLSLGSHDLRLAAGVGERWDDYVYRSYLSGVHYSGNERNRYAYGELSLPVVEDDDSRPGLRRLEFTAAVRTDDYDGFGSDTTPKLGVIYDPSQDVTFKASWGRSFKAPTLDQRYSNRIAYLWTGKQLGCAACTSGSTVLMSYGGNPDLEPERARTWTTSLSFHPEAVPDFDAELTYFHVDYTQRVVMPISYITQVLSNPAYAQFVTYKPSPAQIQHLLSEYSAAFYNYTGESYDPSKVIAIVGDQYTNVAQQRAEGVDLSGRYRMALAGGQLEWHGSVSRLHLDQQNAPGQPDVDLSGMIYYPAKFRGRLGAVWSRSGFSWSAFTNYASGVTSALTAVRQKTASFTTFDTTASYTTAPGMLLLSDITVALSVQNLFNRKPPLFTPPYASYLPYDSTNYSAIGRYLNVSVNKHW